MPAMHFSRSVFMALISISMLSNRQWTMIGSMTFSSSCPASDAIVTVRSLPITRNATWLTTSGITGLTLPGMIDDPGWRGGRLISFSPQRGPDESSRRSLQIFESFTARRFWAEEFIMKAPVSLVASIMFDASTSGSPVISRR